MSDQPSKRLSKPVQAGLIGVAAVSVFFSIIRVFNDELASRLDDTTVMFLAVAVVALIVQQITKFKGFGLEFEQEVRQLREDVKHVGQAVDSLEKGVGPGSKTAVAALAFPPPSDAARTEPKAARKSDPADPNKGKFGGSPLANGRRLSAVIKPGAGPKSSRCKVKICVESTDPARPLTGEVKLHLHPSFGIWSTYSIEVRGGIAEDEIISYGAFTIGAEADVGTTKLELDLIDVAGGTKRFYEE